MAIKNKKMLGKLEMPAPKKAMQDDEMEMELDGMEDEEGMEEEEMGLDDLGPMEDMPESPLAQISDEELMAEIRARGLSGELEMEDGLEEEMMLEDGLEEEEDEDLSY